MRKMTFLLIMSVMALVSCDFNKSTKTSPENSLHGNLEDYFSTNDLVYEEFTSITKLDSSELDNTVFYEYSVVYSVLDSNNEVLEKTVYITTDTNYTILNVTESEALEVDSI